jgi:two-component sensor histidine kinase
MMRRVVPRRQLSRWQGLLLATGATGLAWLLRAALAPVLHDEMPYTLFFLGVLVASIFGGWVQGIAATVLGALAANFSFVASGERLIFEDSRGWGFGVFVLVSLVLVFLVDSLAASLRRERGLSDDLTTVSNEYRHRIKNLLTITQSLVDQTARSAHSIPEFKEKVLDRLHALARAQDLLHVGKAQAVPLHGLIDTILSPFQLQGRLAWPISGPNALVPAETTIALALLLNELATNATKYGALSVHEGRLKLGWTVEGEWTLIEWKEIAGPKVTAPEKRGFGSRLFDTAIPRGSGSAELNFEPDGLRCEIRLRTLAVSEPSISQAAAAVLASKPSSLG